MHNVIFFLPCYLVSSSELFALILHDKRTAYCLDAPTNKRSLVKVPSTEADRLKQVWFFFTDRQKV